MEVSLFSFPLMLWLLNIVALTSSKTVYDWTIDQYSLLSFKNAITSDPRGVLSSNWSANTPVCSWTGVSCSIKHHRVTTLNLSGLELEGAINPHLGNLTFLQSLDISSNNFGGSIPAELSKLRHLKEINVRSNELTGDIPSIFFKNMSSLVEIDMSDNSLTGQLPNDICNGFLSKLHRLNLTSNLMSGRIPAGVYKCKMMEELLLSDNQFSGSIPSEIANLTMLWNLSINLNHMEGDVPASIFNISSLEHVDLSFNNLSGSIPISYNSPKLQTLILNNNNFTGLIPKQVGNITSLINFDVGRNKLSGGLPEELGNLAHIEVLAVRFNDLLNGSIPSSIFNLSSLKKLYLQQNLFSGNLPSNMGHSLRNLEELYLYYNRLSGEIPSSIVNASNLSMLELNRNSFTGSIPNFGNLRHLKALRLWENNLTGEESPMQELRFLSSLTNCRDLVNLEVSHNPFMNGVLPASIGNLSTSLSVISISNCSIRGVIPSEIGNLTSLTVLDLSMNKLTGSIPETVGKLKQIGKFFLYENQLEGNIPLDLCQMSVMLLLYLNDNLLAGSIPECLGDVKSLREVSFSSNKLNSTLPSKFFNLVDLTILDLKSNSLSGKLPDGIRSLAVINELYLSSNKFSGHIPASIGNCKSLEHLYLSNNTFTGTIPESLGDARGLLELDLSHNNLSGSIPKSLEKLKLQLFNVSYNQLVGKIPDEGCFANFNAQSFLNNSALCGTPRFQVSPCRENGGRSTAKKISLVMKYVVPPFVAVMILTAAIVVIIRRQRKKTTPPADGTSQLKLGWMVISERELIQATNSFSEENLLGKGSISYVYRATLSENQVAVKVFNLQVEGATKIFESESRIMSSIRHRNLVKILGCCSNMNTDFKALILEYMPNGSLEMWLHSDIHFLDLVQRLKIAIDVALALEYLHHDHQHLVVHRDIKPSNVLLDADMMARVSDFGIAKLLEDSKAEGHTKSMATIGYAAPELGEGKVSTKGDVYSYGILLLEMFTSKRPTDEMFGAEMSIKDWVEKALQEDAVSEIVAPGLVSREDPHFAKLRCVSSILELAMRCSAFSPQQRVDMTQVVVNLQKIKFPVEAVKKKHHKP